MLHLSLNSSPTTVFRLTSNSKNRTVVTKTSSYIVNERHDSELPLFLFVPVFEERLFPYGSKLKMQSIHTNKNPILPVYINYVP